MRQTYLFILIVSSILKSNAGLQFNEAKSRIDSLVYDSATLSVTKRHTEYKHTNGLRVVFRGGCKFKGLTFIDDSNDTLQISTEGVYPLLHYRNIHKSFKEESGTNYQKNSVVKSTVTSKFGSFYVKSYFSNTTVNKIEVRNNGVKYTFQFVRIRKHDLVKLYGEEGGKAVTGFIHWKKRIGSFSIYHKSEPTSISVSYKRNGKVKDINQIRYNAEGLPIEAQAISLH